MCDVGVFRYVTKRARGPCDDVIKRERSVVRTTLNAGGAYIIEAAGTGE